MLGSYGPDADLLVEPAELVRTPSEDFDAARWRLLEKAERTRQAANMIVLHELYFAHLWSGTERAIPQPAFNRLAREFGDDWPTLTRRTTPGGSTSPRRPTRCIKCCATCWPNIPTVFWKAVSSGRPDPPTDLAPSTAAEWQAAVATLRAAVGLPPDGDTWRGLALAAGPDAQVALLVRRGTAFVTPAFLLPRLSWGIWEHTPVAVAAGVAAK
jgi:hypothetical protein